MRLPILRTRGSRELALPDLFGGMNLRDSVNGVNDNQLIDSLNMWKADGTLKTRPATITRTIYDIANGISGGDGSDKTFFGENIKRHNIFKSGSYGDMQLCSAPCKGNATAAYIKIYVFWVGEKEYEQLPVLEFTEEKAIDSYFIVECKSKLYFYTNDQEIYTCESTVEDTSRWEKMNEEDYYAPLVLVHCSSQLGNNANKNHVMAAGTQLEGFNIISPYYRMSYSLYDEINAKKSQPNSDGDTHKYCNAIFDLLCPVNVAAYRGKKVKLEYTYGTQTYKHEVTLNGTGQNQQSLADDKSYRMEVRGTHVCLINTSGVVEFPEGSGNDNVIITAPFLNFDENGVKSLKEDKKRVFSMTESIWFGGDSAGLDGGTRLFLCNNRNKKLKGLVSWSGLNDPTYFSENSYFYVGNSGERVTGFGKQQDMLVIFKERETWYTQYRRNTDISAENLVSQSVVDFTASSVFFPLTQINPNIGCPYPESVQLCRNRLVWLGYDGAVHTLVSNNQYNERSIYTVSEMVQRRLKEEDGKKVSSADWNGYYCLSFGERMYLMDYNCYGYNYISSYSKAEDANIQIPWYYWEIPSVGFAGKTPMVRVNDNLMFVGYLQEVRVLNDAIMRVVFDKTSKFDTVQFDDGRDIGIMPVVCSFTTKLFEFNAPHIRKNVERVNLQLGNNGAAPITVSFITEVGTEEQMIILEGDSAEHYAADFVESKALFPCIRNVARFGIKLFCNGNMAIDGMIIKYKYTGGSR